MVETHVVKQDFSEGCNFNDEDKNNNCWACQFFCFPIGCMYHEREEKNK
jgi:hypothetical protein